MADHEGFEKLDREGYTGHYVRGRYKRSIPVDTIIKICNKHLAQAKETNIQNSDHGSSDNTPITNHQGGASVTRRGPGRGRRRGFGRGGHRGYGGAT
jgi:hypothetical protein